MTFTTHLTRTFLLTINLVSSIGSTPSLAWLPRGFCWLQTMIKFCGLHLIFSLFGGPIFEYNKRLNLLILSLTHQEYWASERLVVLDWRCKVFLLLIPPLYCFSANWLQPAPACLQIFAILWAFSSPSKRFHFKQLFYMALDFPSISSVFPH